MLTRLVSHHTLTYQSSPTGLRRSILDVLLRHHRAREFALERAGQFVLFTADMLCESFRSHLTRRSHFPLTLYLLGRDVISHPIAIAIAIAIRHLQSKLEKWLEIKIRYAEKEMS